MLNVAASLSPFSQNRLLQLCKLTTGQWRKTCFAHQSERADVLQFVLGDDDLLLVGLQSDGVAIEARLKTRGPTLEPLHFAVFVQTTRVRYKRIFLQRKIKKKNQNYQLNKIKKMINSVI